MTDTRLTLSCLSETLAVCRLEANAGIPSWALTGEFTSITRTAEELSIVCRQAEVPAGIPSEKGYHCIKVEGPLDFTLYDYLSHLGIKT